MSNLLILGAGGHGKVVADAAIASGLWAKIAFLDDGRQDKQIMDLPVLGPLSRKEACLEEYSHAVVAIGDNHRRIELLKELTRQGFRIASVLHPSAYISKFARIDPGTVVFAQAAVNPGARIGLGCIVNTGATVDHDCVLGEGVHLSPGVNLAGGVSIGDCTWVGTGASVIQQITVGKNVIIGAGSVIIKGIDDNVTVAGVPGRIIKRHE